MTKETKKNWALRSDIPAYLQGPSNNRWSGHSQQTLVPYKQNTFGPASECKSLSKKQIAEWARRNGYPC